MNTVIGTVEIKGNAKNKWKLEKTAISVQNTLHLSCIVLIKQYILQTNQTFPLKAFEQLKSERNFTNMFQTTTNKINVFLQFKNSVGGGAHGKMKN